MIPLVFICDDNFIMQTVVAITSILANKNPETNYDIYLIMAECSDRSRGKIREAMEESNTKYQIVGASLDSYRALRQMAHIPIACMLKFDICELVPDCDKLLYLDGDVIVREDLTELYSTELRGNYAAAVRESYDILDNCDFFNAGVMLFNAKKMRDDNMREKLVAERISQGDRASMDQRTYNHLIGKNVYYLPYRYNCVCSRLLREGKAYSMEDFNRFYQTRYKSRREIFQDAAVVHFAGAEKPWEYRYVTGSSEWYKYYRLSPFGGEPLTRRGWWGHMNEIRRRSGVSQMMRRVISDADKMIGPMRRRVGKLSPSEWNR